MEYPFHGVHIRQNMYFDAVVYTGVGNPNKEASVVVFDIKINEEYTLVDYLGFKFRIDTLIFSTKKFNQRVIPIIVSNEIPNYIEIKKDNRFMILHLTNIFGSRVKELLEKLRLNDFGNMNNAIQALEIITSAGLAKQLKNFLPFIFESLVAELLIKYFQKTNYYYQKIERNKKYVNGEKQKKEFDIWFENDNEILIVECKFQKKSRTVWKKNKKGKLDNACGKYFFEEKYNFLIEDKINKAVKMLFVSSNGFDTSMQEAIDKMPKENKHTNLAYTLTAEELLELCNSENISIKEHRKWFKEIFIKKNKELEKSIFNNNK